MPGRCACPSRLQMGADASIVTSRCLPRRGVPRCLMKSRRVALPAENGRLTSLCHMHIKDHIRWELHAAHRYKSSRWLTGRSGDGLYQPTLIRPTNPFLHVRLLPSPRFVIAPSPDSLRGVVVHWTPLSLPGHRVVRRAGRPGRALVGRRLKPGPPGRPEPAPAPPHHHPRLTLPPRSNGPSRSGFRGYGQNIWPPA